MGKIGIGFDQALTIIKTQAAHSLLIITPPVII
jgi:hypothetical protein